MRILSVTVVFASSIIASSFTTTSPATFGFIRNPSTIDHETSPLLTSPHSKKTTATSFLMAFESPEEIEMDTEDRMLKSVDSVRKNLQSIRTGRANAAILDLVVVDYYGAPTPLNQVASISVPNSQQLSVDPFDKSITADVEKAITESGLGLTPNNDGTVIRINIPSITEERRNELVKQCKAIGEDGKVALRNVRRDGVDAAKKLEKGGDIGKDNLKDCQDAIQKLTDNFVKEIDSVIQNKVKDVQTV